MDCRIFYSKIAEYTFFLKCTWSILQAISYTEQQNSSNKLKKLEVMSIVSDFNGTKVEISYKKKWKK